VCPRDDFIGSRCQDKKGQSQIPDQQHAVFDFALGRVPHLASHILGRVVRRISSDWLSEIRPSHLSAFKPLWSGNAFEAFVTRLPTGFIPVKDIYLYPLTERFREALNQQRLDRKERRKMGGNR